METAIVPGLTATGSKTTMIRSITADHLADEALADLWLGLERYDLWTAFALHEIRQRFRRSLLGPFWLTASMGIFVGALGLISTTLFKQDVHLTLPYIATGVIFWGFLTSAINEGANCFISREGYIRNVPLPVSVHLYQMLMRNLIIWVFNMAIYVVVLLLFGINPGWTRCSSSWAARSSSSTRRGWGSSPGFFRPASATSRR